MSCAIVAESRMKRTFPFHDLSDDEFEQLIVHMCMKVLGMGTVVFAKGRDGGRDGSFNGTANAFPSSASPLSGKFIIQAKHTSNPIASCSHSEFGKILDNERPKISRLVKEGELDHYLLFTNRTKPASKTIAKERALTKLKLKTVHVFGVEQLREWLTAHPAIWASLGFDRFDSKFAINAPDLGHVVRAFHSAIMARTDVGESALDFDYVTKSKKNKINRLSDAYDDLIRSDSLKFFKPIYDFLSNPRNEELRDLYHDTADEIRAKLTVGGHKFDRLDDALTFVYDHVIESDPALRGRKRYVRVFLHYMYWTCDIGQHDHSDKAP